MTDMRWERWAAATGVAFAVLAVVGFLFAMDLPGRGDSSEAILSWFVNNEGGLARQAFFFALALMAFLWFIGTLAAAIRRAENDPAGRLPAITVVAGATAAALYMGGEAILLGLSNAGNELNAATARLGYEAATSAFALTTFVAAVFVAAVSLAVLRTGLLPNWIAYAGGASIVLALIDGIGTIAEAGDAFGAGGAFGTISFLAFLAWTLVTSAMLTQRVGAEAPAPRMAPAA